MKRILTSAQLRKMWDPLELRKRLLWVLGDRERVRIVGGDQTKWSVKAGLSKDTLGAILRRCEEPKFAPECRSMAVLARSAELSAGWLAFGEGTPDSFGSWQNGTGAGGDYPNLQRAIILASLVEDEILPATIEEARKIKPGFPRDHGVLEWLDDIREMDARRRTARQDEHRHIVDKTGPSTHPASASYKSAKGRDDDS